MPSENQQAEPITQEVWDRIREAIETLRFGTVEVTVHESRVVQVERKEKLRFHSR